MSNTRWTLAGLSLSMLLSALGTSIANIALPALADAFRAPFQHVQWVVLAYLLAVTTLIVTAGRLGDLAGRRRLFVAGIAIFTAASAFCAIAPSLGVLIAARAIQGAGAAVMMALTIALAGESVPKEKTGSAMGLLGTMSAIGTALGPSAGGALIATIGWRSIFAVTALLGVAALLLAQRTLPADARTTNSARFDPAGTLLLALSLGAYALSMTIGRGRFGALNIALLCVSIAIGVMFVLAEKRAASPLIRIELLRDPVLGASLAANALVSAVMMATLVVGPFYLARTLGLDAAMIGLVSSAGPLVAALSGVPAGRIVDRHGAQRTGIVALAGIAAAAFALSMMPARFGVAGYAVPLVILTAHYALFQAANNTSVMMNVPQDQRGVISGMLNLSRNAGLITGASVMGAVFAAAGMRVTFAAAALLIAGMCAAVARVLATTTGVRYLRPRNTVP